MDWLSGLSNPMFWIILLVIFSVVEAITLGLTSLWFAMAAAVAMVAAMLGAPFYLQVIVFVIFSILFLVVTKPLAKNFLKIGGEKTNVESLIGERGLVIGKIEEFSMGQVKIKGQIWSALSENGEPILLNEQVVVKSIEGVKLIVEPASRPSKPSVSNE